MSAITLPDWPPVLVVDASVWVARLIPQDRNHEVAVAWWRAFADAGARAAAPSLMLAEVGGAVSRRTERPQLARRTIAMLLSAPELILVPMERDLSEATARLAAELGLRGADAAYAALALRFHVPLISLDKDHAARAGRRIRVVDPAATSAGNPRTR